MEDDASPMPDSWRIDQEIMRRNSAPAVPAAVNVDDLIRFLDQALFLAGGSPAPRTPAEYPRPLI